MFETLGSAAAVVAVTEVFKRMLNLTGPSVVWLAGIASVLVVISWELASPPAGIDWTVVPQGAILGWLAAMGAHSAFMTHKKAM